MNPNPPWLTVFLLALLTAVATGVGALPFAFVRGVAPRVVAYANSVAAGLMLGASFGLISAGSPQGHAETLAGALLGILFILATDRLLAGSKLGGSKLDVGQARGLGARRMILIVLVMTVHSAAEGIAVGASFGGGVGLAFPITLAIAVHNMPEGLAISAVLRPQGKSLAACAGWSIFSSLPQPLLAVPAYLFVDAFKPSLPYALGFAAGAMVFMVLLELLPEALELAPAPTVAWVTSASLVAMVLFQNFL